MSDLSRALKLFTQENTEKAIKEYEERRRNPRNNKRTPVNKSKSIGSECLKQFYVYVLIDPRDDVVFYVGKGQEDRIFQHEADVKRGAEDTAKQKRILEIINSGQTVKKVVIGRFDTHMEAHSVEAVLIHWMYGKGELTNIASGHGVDTIRPKGHLENLPGIDEPELAYCERTKNNREKNDIISFLNEIKELIERECEVTFDGINTSNDRHTYLVKYIKGVRLAVVSHHTAKRAAAVTIESLSGGKEHKQRVIDICEQTKLEAKDKGRYGRIMPPGSSADPYAVMEKFKETLAEIEKVF